MAIKYYLLTPQPSDSELGSKVLPARLDRTQRYMLTRTHSYHGACGMAGSL